MRLLGCLVAAVLFAAGCSGDPAASDPAARTTETSITAAPTTTAEPTTTQPGLVVSDLTEEIEFEWIDTGCAGLAFSRLHSIDVESGRVEWSIDTPWAPDGPVVLDGDSVLLVEKSHDSPSVVAYDLATGAGRWQMRLDGAQAQLVAVDGHSLAVAVAWKPFTTRRAGLVDADGVVTELPVAVGGVAHNDQGPDWWQSPYVIGRDGAAWDPFADPPTELASTALSKYQAVVIGDAAVAADGGRIGFSDRAVSWEVSVPVDGGFAAMVDVRVGAESILILMGSELGPDRRLVVLDRLDGSTRWTLDGVRDADVAGDRIIYDRRIPAANREVFLVDQNDPEVVVWSAAADERLGGFLATLNGVDHFVHRDPTIWPRAPYPEVGAVREVQQFDPELLLIGDEGPAEAPLHGGSQWERRAPGPQMASGDGWTAVIIGELIWLTIRGETISTDLGDQPQHLLATENGLLATTGAPEVGCD